ncbi:MAG: aspartate carbamoyltransferase [Oscillospiraceae bacterium]|jgi:aspartate carbamoyltransferase catalytic subunit|nr:aspartate carbamoyltransferase [Oscillospiraceae bacterium]
MRHIISFEDISPDEWARLYGLTLDIIARPGDYARSCAGRVMAALFYEPSTRTNFSFQAAMQRLGGGVIGFSDPSVTSASKGETMRDTMIMVSGYSDSIVMRHPCAGAAKAASLYSSCPVINAGDGGHFHPTQTLTDLAAITRLRGGLRGMSVGICGDLKYGRTVHSLITALARFEDVTLHLISPRQLACPKYLRVFMQQRKMRFYEVTNLEAALGSLDVLYMTRIQRERFDDPKEYDRLKGVYVLTARKLSLAKGDLLILHPLPRVDEINPDVDGDPRAKYFFQAETGMYARMALLLELTALPKLTPERDYTETGRLCRNPGCITFREDYLPFLEENGRCVYCDYSLKGD